MARCAVLGSPIAHSLSPVMHRAAYAELGLDWTYEAIEVREDGLAAFLDGLDDGWRGLSVTAPLKRAIVPLVTTLDDEVERLGVGNTILLDGGTRSAHNTDVPGAVAALAERGVEDVELVRILGGGATAASFVSVAQRIGARRVELFVREPTRAESAAQVAETLGLEVEVRTIDKPILDVAELLVSTVPSDVIGSRSHELVESARAVFDVVYDPWPSRLVEAALGAERPAVSGLDLLAHQAALQVELMTGGTVDVAVLRDAALDSLSR
jgi:shikimate dehydrogenase